MKAAMDHHEQVPVGEVDNTLIDRVERHQGKKFQRIGMFDSELLREFAERISEKEVIGEIELLMLAENMMHDGSKSGLLVARCNGGKNTFALAGLTDNKTGGGE